MSKMENILNSPPSDTISKVIFSPTVPNHLLVSSWDGVVRLYDTYRNCIITKYRHDAPVLSCSFMDSNSVISGGLDLVFKYYDINSQQEMIFGHHKEPIRRVDYIAEQSIAVTGSWDKTVKLWDIRSPIKCIGSYLQPDKVYALSHGNNKLVIGTASRRIMIYDIRKMDTVLQKRDSGLKYQTRDIACFPNHDAFVISSIEGRVAIEYIDTVPEIQEKKYAFKCHRIKENNIESIYPVNAIAFHKQYNTFATGGSDGFASIWDGINKKRLCQFRRYPTAITSLSFNCEGSLMATSISNIHQTEDLCNEREIYIRQLSINETKPKI